VIGHENEEQGVKRMERKWKNCGVRKMEDKNSKLWKCKKKKK
jgi:hypothetical protein